MLVISLTKSVNHQLKNIYSLVCRWGNQMNVYILRTFLPICKPVREKKYGDEIDTTGKKHLTYLGYHVDVMCFKRFPNYLNTSRITGPLWPLLNSGGLVTSAAEQTVMHILIQSVTFWQTENMKVNFRKFIWTSTMSCMTFWFYLFVISALSSLFPCLRPLPY